MTKVCTKCFLKKRANRKYSVTLFRSYVNEQQLVVICRFVCGEGLDIKCAIRILTNDT